MESIHAFRDKGQCCTVLSILLRVFSTLAISKNVSLAFVSDSSLNLMATMY